VEDDLVAERPVHVTSRFELAAARIADAWLRAGRMTVSRDDFLIARQFLLRDGWKVEELAGVRVRLVRRDIAEETTREGAVIVALRRLAAPWEGPALAVCAAPGHRAEPAPRPVPVPPAVSGRAHMREAVCPAELPA
jgi:hypothetical protein